MKKFTTFSLALHCGIKTHWVPSKYSGKEVNYGEFEKAHAISMTTLVKQSDVKCTYVLTKFFRKNM